MALNRSSVVSQGPHCDVISANPVPRADAPAPWAQAEDWDKHCTTITDLYVNRRKKLKAIIQIMAEEYGFYATQRMYKTRFKKWGLAKNNIKPKPACVEDHRPVCASGPVMSASRSQETDRSKRPIAPIMTIRQITNHGSIHALQPLGTPSAIRSVAAPDCYKCVEGTVHYTRVYISSTGLPNLGSASSVKRLVTDPAWAKWLDCMLTAKALLKFGHFQRAVLLIDMCCHQYRSLVGSPDPSILPITVTAIHKILRYWPNLAKALLKFVCTMSQIVLGTPHPLSMLFHEFREAGVDHLAYCMCMTLQYFLGGIVHVMPHPRIESYGDFYHDMLHGKFLDTSSILSELQHLQHRLQHRLQPRLPGQPESELNFLEETTAIQCRIAWLNFYAKRHEDATELLWGMLSEPTVDACVVTGCFDVLHHIAVAENKQDSALEMIQKAVEASVEAYGYAHSATVAKMARLESCLRSMGRLPEADKVHSSWEMQLAQICDKTRRLRI